MIRKVFVYAVTIVVTISTTSVTHSKLARDQIRVVGSSTVYPFATTVAEQFGKSTRFRTPVVESTGSGGGFKLFCAGLGVKYPDITNASRRIKKSELDACFRNDVTDIVEVKIGYDGIVLAHAKASTPLQLTRTQIFLALAKQTPLGGKLVNNPYQTWQDIDVTLPTNKVEVLGPPSTSGTRDTFVELVMEVGCQVFPEYIDLKTKDQWQFMTACQMIREDGAFIEAGENDNLIVQKLTANPKAFGIFGFSFLGQNTDLLQSVAIDGHIPTFDNIANGHYPITRPLYFYVKKSHIDFIPGLKEYIAEFTSEKALGLDGYLVEKGLISLPDEERKVMHERARSLAKFDQ